MTIETERLDLIPMSVDFLRASLTCDRPAAERLLDATIPPDWPEELRVLTRWLSQLETDPAVQPWLARAMVLRGPQRIMIGHLGFHTAPGPDYLQVLSPGAVELGFCVFPSFQRRGFAREAVVALMAWARKAQPIPAFIVSIVSENTASQALASQLGFVRIGSARDDEDGREDLLELRTSSTR